MSHGWNFSGERIWHVWVRCALDLRVKVIYYERNCQRLMPAEEKQFPEMRIALVDGANTFSKENQPRTEHSLTGKHGMMRGQSQDPGNRPEQATSPARC